MYTDPPALFAMVAECGTLVLKDWHETSLKTREDHRQKTMKPLSANKAAKLAKKTKQTILDAINDNSLSATKNERGHWQIDPAELNRVFPYEIEDRKEDQSQKPEKTTQETIETSALGVELKFLRERLTEKDETIRKMEAERENERELLERNLDDLRTAMARITDQRDGQGRGWWPFGRKKAKTA